MGSKATRMTLNVALARDIGAVQHGQRFEYYLRASPSRKAIASSSTRTASMTGTTGRAWNSKAGNIEHNLLTPNRSSHSSIIYPPHSPTPRTNNSIFEFAGHFPAIQTCTAPFWAFSYSIGHPY